MVTMEKSEEYWKQKLTPEQYNVLRQGGTEAPFTGKYVDMEEKGMYKCKACGQVLFTSDTKFHSGSGWPSFFDVVDKGKVELKEDKSLGMNRIEVTCNNCKSHLGHLFEDGPTKTSDGKPCTGKRYCINSTALDFEKKDPH
ncbi:peptide-methionine (R)-S-oxide reductase [candidate division WWE3 bacterium CG10_big_fil_rev_8_21_14_0_10_32_10]|uniref:peptide-methionine (R)-S-oxide reductase n=1 Tax=candidate division WWE3 bacterium CG10_big_fil_rev_8_21_14_0_10_32_10 TaxID=1975090 RepID=A0A2H0RB72_UNCKA|nr:MAG: peptide-methionine (R)-S-oxide reductase [candidate division WWE3 bacterium CG10_big_fil_rev_8_21_14_0_10_32_10]